MKKELTKIAITAAMVLAFGSSGQAANIGTGYTQNFDSMGTTGTTLPTDWTVWKVGSDHASWTTSITANGASDSVQAMTSAGTTLSAAMLDSSIVYGTKNAMAYNIAHAATPTDRVLSTSPTGIDGNALQLSLTNNTGGTLNSINVSYDIVKFYDGTKQSSINSNYPVGEELPGYQLFYSVNGGSWVNVSALNPVATADGIHPVVAAGTPAAYNTNGSVDYSVTSINNALVTLATSWGIGQTLNLRWVDDNAVNISNDQVIGLDNVNVNAASTPIPAAAWLLGSGLIGLVGLRRRSQG